LLDGPLDARPGPEARYTSREAVELAFVTGLQLLPPRQAATLVLRDVLGFSGTEVADMLGTTVTAIKGTLQRARASLDRAPAGHDRTPAPGSAAERALARRFADAFAADDIAAVVELLTDDAWLAMPPAPHEYHGPAAIVSFLRASAAWRRPRRLELAATGANGQPAFTCSFVEPGSGTRQPAGLLVLELTQGRVRTITRFLPAATRSP
jgi:RNA polymerase sigma-70 factor (ECF subfamily)